MKCCVCLCFCCCAAMCSNYMARLDVVNEEWHNCEGPRLSRLHAGVTGTGGAGFTLWGLRVFSPTLLPLYCPQDNSVGTELQLALAMVPRLAELSVQVPSWYSRVVV